MAGTSPFLTALKPLSSKIIQVGKPVRQLELIMLIMLYCIKDDFIIWMFIWDWDDATRFYTKEIFLKKSLSLVNLKKNRIRSESRNRKNFFSGQKIGKNLVWTSDPSEVYNIEPIKMLRYVVHAFQGT